MIQFKPFRALLPNPKHPESVVSRTFDSYSKTERETILQNNPNSFLHVIVPIMNEYESKTLSYQEILTLGKNTLARFIDQGNLIRDDKNSMYVYRQSINNQSYTGFIGAASIDDYLEGRIKKHEQTLEHKEHLLKQYLETVDIHAEPVYLIFEDKPELKAILNKITTGQAYSDFFDDLGRRHQVWRVFDDNVTNIESLFGTLSSLYIADGHHRCASSALFGLNKRDSLHAYTGNESFNFFLAVAMPESEARLYEFSRLVQVSEDFSKAIFLGQIADNFDISKAESPVKPAEKHEFGLYIDNTWYKLRLKSMFIQSGSAFGTLDPYLLNEYLFSPFLGIHDLRKDKRVKFIGGQTDTDLLMNQVNSGKYEMAFTVHPVDMNLFRHIADEGLTMPPKSTWFEPKFLSGMVIFPLFD
jgi:uncharacterized protein (DUF1015 family)